ncbi:MAG TPA: thioredoxin family protein [Ktedonobacterales bacterium]|jgi:thiol-disulfide isomerase/thioredoxin
MPDQIDYRRHGLVDASSIALASAGFATIETNEISDAASEGNMPSLSGATAWLNSEPLTAAALRGKVVLVDFWTYTCINWLRTLPYIRAWAETYRDQGLVTLGIHTPEFPFEHDLENVRQAVKAMRIAYPVAVDSDYAVWNAFNNHFWPALYLFDVEGQIRHHHFGEGDYARSEIMIQRLLAEGGNSRISVGDDLVVGSVAGQGIEADADWSDLETPETYLGYERADHFASPEGAALGVNFVYTAPSRLRRNHWALAGDWTLGPQAAAVNMANGRIAYQFHSRDLHLVMGPATRGSSARFKVRLDGQEPGAAHGSDIDEQGDGALTEQRTYQLIRQPQPIDDRRFEIEFLDPGAQAFAFTFG